MTDTVTVQKNLPVWVLENDGIIEDWSFSHFVIFDKFAHKYPHQEKCRIFQPPVGAKLKRGEAYSHKEPR